MQIFERRFVDKFPGHIRLYLLGKFDKQWQWIDQTETRRWTYQENFNELPEDEGMDLEVLNLGFRTQELHRDEDFALSQWLLNPGLQDDMNEVIIMFPDDYEENHGKMDHEGVNLPFLENNDQPGGKDY